MNKSALKEVFTNAKAVGARYIGVKVKAAGSSQPEIIINPKENFDEKLKYYMSAYDDDLILIPADLILLKNRNFCTHEIIFHFYPKSDFELILFAED